MMITVEKLDEVYLLVNSTPDIEMELSEYFKFQLPNAKFMPSFRNGMFDGYLRLYSIFSKTLYIGLLSYLRKFAESNNYPLDIKFDTSSEDIDLDEITKYIQNLNPYSKGVPIECRDYQINSVYQSLKHKRLILSSPVSSGKSLIIYALLRKFLDEGKRVLLVVPKASLVEQMYTDFEDYSSYNGWSTEDNCQRLYSGRPKYFEKPITISTWQSIFKNPKSFFLGQKWDCVIVDECHTAAAASLTGILEKMTTTQYRIGLSGTTANTKTARLVLEGLFGEVHSVITTKQLMDRDQIAQLKIKSLVLKYPDEYRKAYHKCEYQDEVNFIVGNEQRNKFITNLAKCTRGNTLILSQYVEKHCDILMDLLRNNSNGKTLHYITGSIDVKTREEIRKQLETESNSILVGTYGSLSVGNNMPSIQNIIFASPTKSMIRTLQSIGRGLRLAKDKSSCTLFDITDDLSWKTPKSGKKQNHTLKHGIERYHIYMQEQFSCKITDLELYPRKELIVQQ